MFLVVRLKSWKHRGRAELDLCALRASMFQCFAFSIPIHDPMDSIHQLDFMKVDQQVAIRIDVRPSFSLKARVIRNRSSRSGQVCPPIEGGSERPKPLRIDAVCASASLALAINSIIADAPLSFVAPLSLYEKPTEKVRHAARDGDSLR